MLVIDAGRPRNYASNSLHNYLSRDGIAPRTLRHISRREVRRYGGVVRAGLVASAVCTPGGFDVRVQSGETRSSRTLLLATGVSDELPRLRGALDFYGRGVHHCPYCDAWRYRDRPLAAYGPARAGLGLALSLLTWSADVTVVTNGERPEPRDMRTASRLGINVRQEQIARLEGAVSSRGPARRGPLRRIVFRGGPPLAVAALFFNTDKGQRSRLPVALGCRVNQDGGVIHDRKQRTGVPGLYLAGDASFDVQFAIVAAAEGAKAAVAMNRELQERDRALVLRRKAGP